MRKLSIFLIYRLFDFVYQRVLRSRAATGGKEAAHRDAVHAAGGCQKRLYHPDAREQYPSGCDQVHDGRLGKIYFRRDTG